MASRIAGLNDSVQEVARRMADRSSLKNALSAGILLLAKVPPELRELALDAANGRETERFEQNINDLLESILSERVRPALLQAQKKTLVDIVHRAEDEEVAAMLGAIGEMIEKDGGQRILGPKASIGAGRLRDILIKSFKKNAKKQLP